MDLVDKLKEIGDEIKKTVEDSGIKDKAKCATLIVKDTVDAGVKKIENKFEEKKQEIEDHKKFVESLQLNLKIKVEDAVNNEEEAFYGVNRENILQVSNEFFNKIYILNDSWLDSDIFFGEGISSKKMAKILQSHGVEDSEEKGIISYYKNGKENYLLTNERFYFTAIHPIHEEVITTNITIDKIDSISLFKDEEATLLEINGVQLFTVGGIDASILEAFLELVKNNQYTISSEMVSEVIKKSFEESMETALNEILEEGEYYTFVLRRKIKGMGNLVIMTNKRIVITEEGTEKEINVSNVIMFKDIVYYGAEQDDKDIISSMFKEKTLEVVAIGNKFKFEKVKEVELDKMINIISSFKKIEDVNGKQEEALKTIEKLWDLKNQGAITEEEFMAKKAELLARV